MLQAQVYYEQASRHRFAQLTLGVELESGWGGQTSYLATDGSMLTQELASTIRPRILIGGMHFWGHADFSIAFPLSYPEQRTSNLNLAALSGVETIFKYYPIAVRRGGIRPYLGFSLAPYTFFQDNSNLALGEGPSRTYVRLPLKTGLTFSLANHLFDLGLTYNYANTIDYPLSPELNTEISTAPLFAHVSYRYQLETTLSAERGWENGSTQELTDRLAENGGLNDFFVGIGLSSAWWLGRSDYVEEERPFLPGYNTAIMPDFSLGYYLHQPDLQLALSYRAYASSHRAFGVFNQSKRQSIGLELTKNLFDYNGFVPFLGPVVSRETLSFNERDSQGVDISLQERKTAFGIAFGWDVRPNRIQSFILRTNLRYFPNLFLEHPSGRRLDFDAIEFNFIQLVLFPERLF
ncbi:MAG: hypothetical protein AAF433_12380 [Bacteroidota bacterium]